jgi:acyl-CoA synthetase (AMP-forming)/AMP-acid ligase II
MTAATAPAAATIAGASPIITESRPVLTVPDVSLPELLLGTALYQASRPAIIDAASGRVLTYRELADRVRGVAAGLAALGLVPGQAFAIMAPNSPEWLTGCFGAMLAGGVVAGIDPLSPAAEIDRLGGAAARFVLATPEFVPAVPPAWLRPYRSPTAHA